MGLAPSEALVKQNCNLLEATVPGSLSLNFLKFSCRNASYTSQLNLLNFTTEFLNLPWPTWFAMGEVGIHEIWESCPLREHNLKLHGCKQSPQTCQASLLSNLSRTHKSPLIANGHLLRHSHFCRSIFHDFSGKAWKGACIAIL